MTSNERRAVVDLYIACEAALNAMAGPGDEVVEDARARIQAALDHSDTYLGTSSGMAAITEQEAFAAHLQQASAIVGGWPEWKRRILA